MSNTVWKFSVPAFDSFEIKMPAGARVLAVQTQSKGRLLDGSFAHTEVCLWALVDTTLPAVTRRFRTFVTGEAVAGHFRDHNYIGTFQPEPGHVFHMFEDRVTPPSEEVEK